MKVAIVGSGIAGLAVAHTLHGLAEITLLEAGDHFGGHSHTVDITLATPQERPDRGAKPPTSFGVDTGFAVFNEHSYPNLVNLLTELGVATAPSQMSFSVQLPGALNGHKLEWSSSSPSAVFAHHTNLLNWRFLRMLGELARFKALASGLARRAQDAELMQPLAHFLRQHRFSDEFRDWCLLPLVGCIWSCPTEQALEFPLATVIRFIQRHGLLQLGRRPPWRTVVGGARHYVDRITARIADRRLNTPVRLIERDAAGVRVLTDGAAERFDKLVLATHADQSLALLREPSASERATLGAIRFQPNRAVLHTDATVLPDSRRAWAAWNYERAQGADRASARVGLHCLLNRLQPLPAAQPVLLSLSPLREIAPEQVLAEWDYAHPVFDLAAVRAQADMTSLQGRQHSYFCGAWMGDGSHEDGLKAGLAVARELLIEAARHEAGTA
ncbi:MAG: NAD(P)/FAD-dependent oxidoreductase [Burkholderiaceae bacterium]